MSNTVENICYEYSEDVLFSLDISISGNPVKIICYINSKYLCELSKFLHNYHYELESIKKFGKNYILVRFLDGSGSDIKKSKKDTNIEREE